MIYSLRNFGRTWLACKNKYKVLLIEYKNDKRLMKFQDNDRLEWHYYEYMDMWNRQRASGQENEDHYIVHTTHEKLHASAT